MKNIDTATIESGDNRTNTDDSMSCDVKLYVLSDERGDLFLSSEENCRASTSPVVLEDVKLWDAYIDACRAMHQARRAVKRALKAPRQPVTPETLTMQQIADVARWARDNGRKGAT